MRKIYRSSLKSVSLALLLMAFSLCALAQTRTVTGTVKDASDLPLPGVNVIKKGTTSGTATDANGHFSIEATDDDILLASFIGYQPTEVRVGNQSTISIVLVEDISTLQEVVVVGYGTQKKSDLTGAISSIDGGTLRSTLTASADQALQGRVAGVQVTQNSGQPGGVVSIRIRGTTSLTGSSEPLYVIDGIQVSGNGSGIAGFDWQKGAGGQQVAASNPLATINPQDIESIEVLKDASATAIYGSRAANGVIIITTKRGKSGDATLSYNGYYGLQEPYKTFDMMNLRQYADYNNEVAKEVNNIGANPKFADPSLLGSGTDWQDAVLRVAPMQSHSLTATGGNDRTKYMLSGGYFKQDGIIIGSNFDRFNVRLNLDSRVKENVTLGASLSFASKNEKIILSDGGDGVISQALQMPPNIPVREFNGDFAGPDQSISSAQIGSNPVALALLRNNTVASNRIMTNMYGEVEIIKGLKFRSEIAIDLNNSLNKSFFPTYKWGTLSNPTSQLAQRADKSFYWLWKNYATYSRNFGNHDLSAMIGIEAQKGQYDNFTAYKINLPNDIPVMNQGEISNRPNDGAKGWNSMSSQFARVNYGYRDRYLLTATVRRDGSSRFGPDNRWGIFPSMSAAWRVSNEDFFSGLTETISNFKLRFGWGQVGNQEIRNYAFGSALNSYNSFFGPSVINSAYSNPGVQWESTTMTNIGLDLELFSGRVNLTADAYIKDTDNLLLAVPLPATFGDIVGGPQANVGSMENRGVELGLSTVNIDRGKFKWSSTLNVTINRNKVTALGGPQMFQKLYWYEGFETATVTRVGAPVGQFYGYVMEGIFTSKEEIMNHAVQIVDAQALKDNPDSAPQNLIDRTKGLWLGDIKWKDINGDGMITTADQKIIGDPNPDFTFGFNNTFSYGPFDLTVFVLGSVGGDILNYSRVRNQQMLSNYDNQDVAVFDRARTTLIDGGTDINNIDQVELINPTTDIPRFDNGGENHNHYMSTRWIEDGTFVRIQNVKLAYTLPASITNKISISHAQFYINIQNLITFTNYTGLDPQIGAFNQSPLMQNIDMGRYPTPRVYTLGVNINF